MQYPFLGLGESCTHRDRITHNEWAAAFKVAIIMQVCSTLLAANACAAGPTPSTQQGQQILMLGKVYPAAEALAQLGEMLDSPDESVQLQALLRAAPGLMREEQLPERLICKIEALLDSKSRGVQKAAGYALYCAPHLVPSDALRKGLHSPNFLVRFYVACSLLHGSQSPEDMESGISALVALLQLAPEIGPGDIRLLDREKNSAVLAADDELRRLAKGHASYPQRRDMPLASVRDMPIDDYKKLTQDNVDEFVNWWKEHRNEVISETIIRNRTATTQPVSR